MRKPLRINFVLAPSENITGGALAIIEYATRFAERGHVVSITTYPDSYFPGDRPFPWCKFDGPIHYARWQDRAPGNADMLAYIDRVTGEFGNRAPFHMLLNQLPIWAGIIEATPECDLNIATLWSTGFPVYFSR